MIDDWVRRYREADAYHAGHPWWRRHPVAATAIGVLAVSMVITYWQVFLPFILIGGGAAVWFGRAHYRAQRDAELSARADHAYRTGDVLPPRPPWQSDGQDDRAG